MKKLSYIKRYWIAVFNKGQIFSEDLTFFERWHYASSIESAYEWQSAMKDVLTDFIQKEYEFENPDIKISVQIEHKGTFKFEVDSAFPKIEEAVKFVEDALIEAAAGFREKTFINQ